MVLLAVQRLAERLTAPLDVDAYLATVNPLWGVRTRGRIESITPMGQDAASIRIRPGAGWAGHRPGQFVTLGVDVDGVRHHRSFTLTSVPGEAAIEVTVQASPGGTVSPHLVKNASIGEVVQVAPAAGGLELQPDEPMLFVAGGSGVTPTMGVLRALDRDGATIDAVVLHHSVSPERALFTDELDELSRRHPMLRVEHIHSRADGSHRLDAERLGERCPDWRTRRALVCGPDSMLDAAESIWSAAELEDRLHLERFHPATIDLRAVRGADGPDAPPPGLAHFTRADVVAPADSVTSLLDVAEAAGLRPASGCRMGICHTCTTRLDAGCVRDLRDGRERRAGSHVQLCVSAAEGDVLLDL